MKRMISRKRSARYGQINPMIPMLAATTFDDDDIGAFAPGWCFAQ